MDKDVAALFTKEVSDEEAMALFDDKTYLCIGLEPDLLARVKAASVEAGESPEAFIISLCELVNHE